VVIDEATSTLFVAYPKATHEVLDKHGGPWFDDEEARRLTPPSAGRPEHRDEAA
jgi:hypothetical protein